MIFFKSSTDYKTTVAAAEKSLQELEFSYIKNHTDSLTEFEMNSPPYFRIVIEPNRSAKVRNFPMYELTSSKGVLVGIHFGVDDSREEQRMAGNRAKPFVKSLLQNLPTKPWIGMDGIFSHRIESSWKEFTKN
jgi:hypothetical protein